MGPYIALVLGTGMLASLVATFSGAQEVKSAPVDDPEMYAVYSSLLRNSWIVRAKATNLVVQEETATDWRCLPSGKPMKMDWREVLDSLRSANNQVHTLRAGHDLGLPYQVVPSSTIAASMDKRVLDLARDGWQGFHRRYPDSRGYLQFSMVGFDAPRRRAMVYVAHHCGGLCGEGSHHLLERHDGQWREVQVPGLSQCHWLS